VHVQPDERLDVVHVSSLPGRCSERRRLANSSCEKAREGGIRSPETGHTIWLFAGSDKGGKTAAVLMSVCATCKALGADPFAYLRDVLDRVSTHPHSRLEELLPDRWKPVQATDPGGRKG
jgi:transposase